MYRNGHPFSEEEAADLSQAIGTAVSKRVHVPVTAVDIERLLDDDGAEIVQVLVHLKHHPRSKTWLFDTIVVAGDVLKSKDVHGAPLIRAVA